MAINCLCNIYKQFIEAGDLKISKYLISFLGVNLENAIDEGDFKHV